MIPSLKSLKNKRVAAGLVAGLLLLAGGFFITGCGDDASYESKLFDARQALDDENWAKAMAILESLPQTEQVLQYLSNSYAGMVGLNTFDFLTTIDELDNENGDNTGSIDMIGKLIGAENDVLSCEAATDKLIDITTAIDTMMMIQTLLGVELDNDQKVQLGLASITRTVVIIAKLICEQTGNENVTMTEEWIKANRDNFLPISTDTWNSSPVDASYADMLMEDIDHVDEAIIALTESSGNNDIQDDFQEFRNEIDNGQGGTAGDGTITLGEMNYYLQNM